MSDFFVYREDKKQELVYGFDPDEGYFYQIFNLAGIEESERTLTEKKSTQTGNLLPEQFRSLLQEWQAPHEHILAVSLKLPF